MATKWQIVWLLLTLDPEDQLLELVLESSDGGNTYQIEVHFACVGQKDLLVFVELKRAKTKSSNVGWPG
jgi:hypothetical protein